MNNDLIPLLRWLLKLDVALVPCRTKYPMLFLMNAAIS